MIFCFSLFSRIPLVIYGFNLCFAEYFEMAEMEGEEVNSIADNLGRSSILSLLLFVCIFVCEMVGIYWQWTNDMCNEIVRS